jgi:hypothetical protein
VPEGLFDVAANEALFAEMKEVWDRMDDAQKREAAERVLREIRGEGA